jgi:hypothetical protein
MGLVVDVWRQPDPQNTSAQSVIDRITVAILLPSIEARPPFNGVSSDSECQFYRNYTACQ